MESIVVSVSENKLKVTLNGVEGFYSTSTNLNPEVVQGSRIINPDAFTEILVEQISSLNSPKQKKLPLNILIEPEDIYLHFTQMNKSVEDIHEYIIADARHKLKDVKIEDTYFSYQKIAPFVYQFIAVKKEVVEKLIQISTMAGYELKSVVPWVLLLPKLLTDNDPSIFVSKRNGQQIIALSDLNGIYFSGVYDKEKSLEEIQHIVQELSIYKRNKPISRVFTVNYENLDLGQGYEVYSLPIPVNELVQDSDYKLHILFNNVLGKDQTLFENQLNLLNLLPLPAKEPSKLPAVAKPLALGLLALLLVGGGIFAFISLQDNSTENDERVATETVENDSAVLSETEEATESTSSEDQEESEESDNQEDDTQGLDRSELNIRVENGAEIAGIAGQTQTTLEELGYTVTGIGNFEGETRENTLIQFKDSALIYRDLLLEDLREDFEIVFEDGLDESSDYDVLIIIGVN